MSKTITVKLHFRVMNSGREQLIVPPGMYGIDRSSFPETEVPSRTQAMALIGAVAMGMPLSVWVKADTDEGKEEARKELSRKVRKALMVMDLEDELSIKLG